MYSDGCRRQRGNWTKSVQEVVAEARGSQGVKVHWDLKIRLKRSVSVSGCLLDWDDYDQIRSEQTPVTFY